MDNTKELVEALINGCTTLVARNKYGNVVTITSSFDIPETTLREIEKGILCGNSITKNGILNVTYDLCYKCMEDFERFMKNDCKYQ